MTTQPPRLSVIILAAGDSQRLGQPKQLVQYQGQSLVLRSIGTAEMLSPHETLVITGANTQAIQAQVVNTSARCVYNPDWGDGMGASIATGARSVDEASEGLLILLCDQWRILPEDLQMLAKKWHNNPGRIICSAHGDTYGPPVIFPAGYRKELSLLSGNHGARGVLETHQDSVSRITIKNAAFDLDTPAQLQQLNET